VPELVIRSFVPGDEQPIHDIVSAAFHPGNEAALVALIRDSEEYVGAMELVAVEHRRIVGHVMVSGASITSDAGDISPIAMLSPLAVAPERQRRGVGGALVKAVSAIADQRGEPMIVLEGDPAYYSQFGFEPAAGLGIAMPLPDWAPPEAAQVLRLAAYDPTDVHVRGHVTYPAAFDDFE
jgi:putative acetyltransferase